MISDRVLPCQSAQRSKRSVKPTPSLIHMPGEPPTPGFVLLSGGMRRTVARSLTARLTTTGQTGFRVDLRPTDGTDPAMQIGRHGPDGAVGPLVYPKRVLTCGGNPRGNIGLFT